MHQLEIGKICHCRNIAAEISPENYTIFGAMRILGVKENKALDCANWNERNTHSGGDSPADQRAIKWGYRTSGTITE